jgi:hypothetical protein
LGSAGLSLATPPAAVAGTQAEGQSALRGDMCEPSNPDHRLEDHGCRPRPPTGDPTNWCEGGARLPFSSGQDRRVCRHPSVSVEPDSLCRGVGKFVPSMFLQWPNAHQPQRPVTLLSRTPETAMSASVPRTITGACGTHRPRPSPAITQRNESAHDRGIEYDLHHRRVVGVR